jgi:hypothetical protein
MLAAWKERRAHAASMDAAAGALCCAASPSSTHASTGGVRDPHMPHMPSGICCAGTAGQAGGGLGGSRRTQRGREPAQRSRCEQGRRRRNVGRAGSGLSRHAGALTSK